MIFTDYGADKVISSHCIILDSLADHDVANKQITDQSTLCFLVIVDRAVP